MKVFISSLISGMEAERAAVKRAIEVLGHQPVMAEDFGARASSPQVACLAGLRDADLVVLILGPRYGATQASGLSATHEEFREAQNRKPILTFVQDAGAELEQLALIQEASGWEGGLFRAPFSSAQELGERVSRALYDYAIANATAPLDPTTLSARSLELLPERRRDGSTALFQLALAAGPSQSVLRPAEIEARTLSDALEQRALFGPPPLFDRTIGTQRRLGRGALVIEQEGKYGDGAKIVLWPTADILIQLPAERASRGMGFSVIIEEDIAASLAGALDYASWLLTHIDPTERISHVALASRVIGGSAFGWRTQAEHTASPNSGSVMRFGQEEERDAPVRLSPPHMVRPALTMNRARIVEDLLVLLRRQWNES